MHAEGLYRRTFNEGIEKEFDGHELSFVKDA